MSASKIGMTVRRFHLISRSSRSGLRSFCQFQQPEIPMARKPYEIAARTRVGPSQTKSSYFVSSNVSSIVCLNRAGSIGT